MMRFALPIALLSQAPSAYGCDSLAILPSATADGLGGMYAKNADRHFGEAQPVATVPRMTHPAGATITLDSGLTLPQVPLTYAHAGARPNWAHPYGGYSEGVNEWGVGLGNEHFYSHSLPSDDGDAPQAEFTDLARLVLERTKTATEAVRMLTSLIGQYGQTCKTCPPLANYNSMFMVADTTTIYSVLAVGHEWAFREYRADDPYLNATGVWTISNCLFTGTTNISAGAISSARKYLGYKGTDEEFDFGEVYGIANSCTRGKRTKAFLRGLRKDHKLTKADLMLTLSDHGQGDEPYVAWPYGYGSHVDMHSDGGTISASSMVSDFTTNGTRKIVWHTGPNPCMAVYYPVIFHHDGQVSKLPDFLTSGDAWYAFRHVIYNLAKKDRTKVKTVQDIWKPIQLRFFAQAEEAAERAAQMDAAAADEMLAGVLQNVSETIRLTLVHLNETL